MCRTEVVTWRGWPGSCRSQGGLSVGQASVSKVRVATPCAVTAPGGGGSRGVAVPTTSSLERLAASSAALEAPAVRRRMLVIVNPYATTVSDRLRTLVTYALRGRYEVDVVDTRGPGHATELSAGRRRGGLRRGRDLRRRRDGQRGRQRAGRHGHPLDLPAGRRDERLRQDARHAGRRRRRHRAPAGAGRRLAAAARRPRARQRPALHLLGGRGARCGRGASLRPAPRAQGPLQAVVLRGRGGHDVRRRVRRPPAAARDARGRPASCAA